jgi:hypothetical protein
VQLNLSANAESADQAALLTALPLPETKLNLDTLPLPTEPIVSGSGVVDPNRGSTKVLARADAPRITSWRRRILP